MPDVINKNFLSVDFLFCVDCWVASVSRSPSKGYFNAVVLEALTQQCGSIPVRFDTLKSNLNKLYYASAKCLLQ